MNHFIRESQPLNCLLRNYFTEKDALPYLPISQGGYHKHFLHFFRETRFTPSSLGIVFDLPLI